MENGRYVDLASQIDFNASVFVSARLARSLAPPAVTGMKKQTGQIQKDPNDSKGYTHTPPRGEARF